jgi:serine/threonine protein kinase
MQNIASFITPHSEFFEDATSQQPSREYYDAIRKSLPLDWEIASFRRWWKVSGPATTLPDQGFKVHVSATTFNALDVLDRVVPVCAAANVMFKVVADPLQLERLNNKHSDRARSGKFITIYPPETWQLKTLLAELDAQTAHLEGPYILSDKRYATSNVLYYRYGGFRLAEELGENGTRRAFIVAPDGSKYHDDRVPNYILPPWVEEPFPDQTDVSIEAATQKIGVRFRIEKALRFSNAGGVYRALDLDTGLAVVIKEARPHVGARDDGNGTVSDAISALSNETRVLSRLQHLACVPRLVDAFTEWEHAFLVEEFLPGVALASFRARSDFALLPFDPDDRERVLRFCRKFCGIAAGLIRHVSEIHAAGVILGDLSAYNLQIEPETLSLRFFDFETATIVAESSAPSKFAASWMAPGYSSKARLNRGAITFEDDWYAAGMLLYSLVIPVQALFGIEESAKELFIGEIEQIVSLPKHVRNIIALLWSGYPEQALACVEEYLLVSEPQSAVVHVRARPAPDQEPRELTSLRVDRALRGMGDYLQAIYDTRRQDRLWPHDCMAFQTNPLGLAFGACGPLLALHEIDGIYPEAALQWILDRFQNSHSVEPGFYNGWAGIGWTMCQLGLTDAAEAACKFANQLGTQTTEANFFHGLAGQGRAHLEIFARTGKKLHLEYAIETARKIVTTGVRSSSGMYWPTSSHPHGRCGFGYGTTGIAVYLLAVYRTTGDATWLDAAKAGFDHEMSTAMEARTHLTWPREGAGNNRDPYFLTGGMGIASALLELWKVTADEHVLHAAKSALEGAYSRFSVMPGLFEGLAGHGTVLLDFHEVTGDELYRSRAWEIAQSILCFQLGRPQGIAFPGRGLVRISTDYGYGMAGIACFFSRLARGRGHRVHAFHL